ncbi:hypothetical protein K0M31_013537 [Melipona bicolor]|uniref:Uncharacterized protein n=1 Tax=Melipona bicolor TaxID=60889 RepID=A0AA40FIU8_9HYME|nr:hypothetical protein K0M31_013537 [Melipona bicolor]
MLQFGLSPSLCKSSNLLPSVCDLKSGRWSRFEQAGTSVVPCFERVRENKKRTVDGTGIARSCSEALMDDVDRCDHGGFYRELDPLRYGCSTF